MTPIKAENANFTCSNCRHCNETATVYNNNIKTAGGPLLVINAAAPSDWNSTRKVVRRCRGGVLFVVLIVLGTVFLTTDILEIHNRGYSLTKLTAAVTSSYRSDNIRSSSSSRRRRRSSSSSSDENDGRKDPTTDSSSEDESSPSTVDDSDNKVDSSADSSSSGVPTTVNAAIANENIVRPENKIKETEKKNNATTTTTTTKTKSKKPEDWSSWINTTSLVLSKIVGNPVDCTEVIYAGDNRDPMAPEHNGTYLRASYKGLTAIVQNLNNNLREQEKENEGTLCLVFFKIPSPFFDDQDGQQLELNPVWGRLPATALVMSSFPKAKYFLYLDSDALLAYPGKKARPSTIYRVLSYDGYGEDATNTTKNPGLIVNKPFTGWLCSVCEKFELGHGCFNTGALLWRRSREAHTVLKAWWESRYHNTSQNFFRPAKEKESGSVDEEGIMRFPFWSGDQQDRLGEHMAEQSRLMYIYGTNPEVHAAVWPVPQQKSDDFKSESCPNAIEGKMPCLQSDFTFQPSWDLPDNEPSCFINHYGDDKHVLIEQTAKILATVGGGDQIE